MVFTLTQPATFFVDMLTLPAFSPAPEEVLKYLPGSQDLGQHQVSDGPYQIESWNPTKEIVFTRNPAWTADSDPIRKAYVDKVVVNETVSQDSVQQQLQTGNAERRHGVRDLPAAVPAAGPDLRERPQPQPRRDRLDQPLHRVQHRLPNNGGALKKAEVRQALEYALNRDNIIQVLGGPKVNPPLTHVLPPDIVGSRGPRPLPLRPGQGQVPARRGGLPDGLTLKFLYRSSSEGSSKAFQTVQQDLSDAGIKVEGVPSPDADFYTKYLQEPTAARSGVWDVSLAGWGPDWYGNAALSFFGPLFSGEPSFPPDRQQLRLLRQPGDQPADRPGRGGTRRVRRPRPCGRRPTSR